jgi:osmotically-inducible protein OsmY
MTRSNPQVARDVLDELLWDDSINASRITVATNDGTLVLGGTVDYFYEKWNAAEDAWRVVGVRDVINEITVDAAAQNVLDVDLAASARAGLDANGLVPDGAIKIVVEDGWVTMSGNVRHSYQRQGAERVVRHLRGLEGFTDLVTVSQVRVEAASAGIACSLVRNAAVDADNISVTDSGGAVTLRGAVRSYVERQEAERAAWLAPGVVSVNDQLVIRV